ncbi:unnamed protein product, partial [Prorocentrum cordatum]
ARVAAVVAHVVGKCDNADAWMKLLKDVKKKLGAVVTAKARAKRGYRAIWGYGTIDQMHSEAWWGEAHDNAEGPCMEDMGADEPEFVRGSSSKIRKTTAAEPVAPPHAKAAMPDVTVGGQMQMYQNMVGEQLAAALFANAKLPPREEPTLGKSATAEQTVDDEEPDANLSDDEAALRKLLATK